MCTYIFMAVNLSTKTIKQDFSTVSNAKYILFLSFYFQLYSITFFGRSDVKKNLISRYAKSRIIVKQKTKTTQNLYKQEFDESLSLSLSAVFHFKITAQIQKNEQQLRLELKQNRGLAIKTEMGLGVGRISFCLSRFAVRGVAVWWLKRFCSVINTRIGSRESFLKVLPSANTM